MHKSKFTRLLSFSVLLLLLNGCSDMELSTLFDSVSGGSSYQPQTSTQTTTQTTTPLPAGSTTPSPSQPDLKILTQPQSVTLSENQTLTLSVNAQSELPIRYQWFKNNVVLSGANAASYSVLKSQPIDTGLYHVLLTIDHAELRSLTASVTVNAQVFEPVEPIEIIHSPQGQTITEGDALRLDVEALGKGPFTYRWQKNGSLIPGANNSTYFVANSKKSDAGSYRVIVSNATLQRYSAFATIWVTDAVKPVVIQTQPNSQMVTEDNATMFSVTASGGGFVRYQWRKDGIPLDNAYLASLHLPKVSRTDAGIYDVLISNSQGSIVSQEAYLEVLAKYQPLTINQQPRSQTVQTGNAFALSVSVLSESSPSYQWFRNGTPITGATSPIYNVLQADYMDQGSYSVEVRDAYSSELSRMASITVSSPETVAIELTWDTPETREDGSPLREYEIQAYVIEYGHEPLRLNQSAHVNHQKSNSFILREIYPGILFLRIATVDSDGFQGEFSDAISVFIE